MVSEPLPCFKASPASPSALGATGFPFLLSLPCLSSPFPGSPLPILGFPVTAAYRPVPSLLLYLGLWAAEGGCFAYGFSPPPLLQVPAQCPALLSPITFSAARWS